MQRLESRVVSGQKNAEWRRAKVIIWGVSFLLHEWNLDAWYAGQNDHNIGIRGSKMTFFRPAYHRDSEPKFCIFGVSISWGKGQGRTAGNERERDRVRYPSFQNRDAPALRFGSMNPISRLRVRGSMGMGELIEASGF